MGLDASFHNQNGDELLYFRNHHDLLDQLFDQPHVIVEEPYSDFYVTRPMVEAVLREIETEMEEDGQALPPLPERLPMSFEDFQDEVPEDFFFEEPEDWTDSLPHYRVVLTRLLALVRQEGVLICAWSN